MPRLNRARPACGSVLLALMTAAGILQHAQAESPQKGEGWASLPAILSQIKAPTFSERDFNISDFGAEGDGKTDCKSAFDQAIAKCADSGGGRVIVAKGRWLVNGPLHLKSGVCLHLQQDATILFSNNPTDYLPPVFSRFEGTEVMNYSPPIYAIDQENVAITGEGTLDGQADDEHWWPWKKTGNGDIAELCRMADEGVPPESRVFGEGRQLRPNFIQFYRCKNVLIEGVTIVGAPMWVIHPCLCTNVTVRGVTVNSHGPNNDGCNPESCRFVLIEGCTFDTGDDCIAIKSGRNADGRRLSAPSENIIVRNCTMKDGHGGVTLGSEMSGGIRNVFVEDCSMSSPNLERGIRLKSNSRRGGYLENMFVRSIEVGEVEEAVLHIDLRYADEVGEHPPRVENIVLEDVNSQKSEHPIFLLGIPEAPITGVRLTNCILRNADKPSVLEHVDELVLENVTQPVE
jgi:polygalacturonase